MFLKSCFRANITLGNTPSQYQYKRCFVEDDHTLHQLIVDGELDLHMFKPKDVKDLVPDYLEECREKGILFVRIIHGKGTGTLRRTVHAILERLPWVISFRLASGLEGGWGATIAELMPLDKKM